MMEAKYRQLLHVVMFPLENLRQLKCNKVKSITDSRATKVVCRTTLGLVIDDPTKACEIAEKLLLHFEQDVRVTNTSRDTPRTTFISSTNFTCLQELANMDARLVMV